MNALQILQNRSRTDLRIIDVLSASTKPISINEITHKIKREFGSAHYPNINKKLHEMEHDKLVRLTRIGGSLVTTLNFQNYQTLNLLSIMEGSKQKQVLEKHPILTEIISKIQNECKNLHFVHSLSIINPTQNITLNRIELLGIFKPKEVDQSWRKEFDEGLKEEKEKLRKLILSLSERNLIRIDYLFLDRKEFLQLLLADELNQVKDMISTKVVILNSIAYWTELGQIFENENRLGDLHIDTVSETNPAEITEKDLIYNLARFGYIEFGSDIQTGNKISIEYIIISILIRDDARRAGAIPILIAKNREGITMELLGFLANKYGVLDKLLKLVDTTNLDYVTDLKRKFDSYRVNS